MTSLTNEFTAEVTFVTSKPKYLISEQNTAALNMTSLHPSAMTTGNVKNGGCSVSVGVRVESPADP